MILKNGSTGIQVTQLQDNLRELGFHKGAIDGKFGPTTEASVRAFQTTQKIGIDGMVGPQTQSTIKTLIEKKQMAEIKVANFKDSEFRCPCGKCSGLPSKGVDKEFKQLLEIVRAKNGNKPLTVRSGYRCSAHNKTVGGAKASQHISNPIWAADIMCPTGSRDDLEKVCDEVFRNHGVGMRGWSIVHVDRRPNRARWNYT